MISKAWNKRRRPGKHGGCRPGAGRPPDPVRREFREAMRIRSMELLLSRYGSLENFSEAFNRFLDHNDPNVALRAHLALMDRSQPPPAPTKDSEQSGNVTIIFKVDPPPNVPQAESTLSRRSETA